MTVASLARPFDSSIVKKIFDQCAVLHTIAEPLQGAVS